jgi:ribonucleotide reductase alpha subunit/intein/homing endonuclease
MSEKYSYEDAHKLALAYFNGEEISASVYLNKYAMRDSDGDIVEPTPESMHNRLATEFARIDTRYDDSIDNTNQTAIYYNAMSQFGRIVPQGSVMAAVGNPYQTMSASNCVVEASPEDSISGIFRTAHNLAQLYKRRCGVGFDLSSLRPDGMTVNNAARTTTGAWSFADFFSEVTRKIGQCIAKGERVLTRNGLIPIEEVRPSIDSVWTKNGFIGVSNLFINGSKKIYKLQTSYGFSVRASEDHLFLTEEDGVLIEKRLGDFEEGDSVVLIPGAWRVGVGTDDLVCPEYVKKQYNNSNRLNEDVNLPRNINTDLAYILGLMYGDGGVEYDKFNEPLLISIACAHEHPAVQAQACKIIKRVFGIDASIRPGDGAVNKVTINSKLVCHWLKANSLLKEKSTKIRVPSSILKASSEIQMSFLAGFFDADGTNGKSKKGYSFSTTSFSFAKDIQIMLMANGIISKIHTEDRTSKEWRDLYSVAITGTHAQEALVACIDGGTFPAEKIYERFISKRDNYTTPYKAKSLGVTHNQYDFIPDNSHFVSATAYLKIKSAGEKLAQSGLLIKATVSSITEDGVEETFDLELPEEHLFWCEGFYVHNSGRRGALMITLDVHHPDVLKFTNMKHDLTQVTGANISLRLSDEFLKAVEDGTDYEVRWPCESKTPKISRKVSARRVWDAIVDSATKSAEPGLVLWNNAVRTLPAHCYPRFKSVSTNPCSEIILSASDSCRLISLNLTNYVNNPFEGTAQFDFDRFIADVAIQARMGDNLVDLELELIEKIITVIKDTGTTQEDVDQEIVIWQKLHDAGRDGRRTGLGTHGLADALAQLRIRYDSDAAIEMVDKIYRTFKETAYRTSVELAKIRGPFPEFNWELEKDNPFIKDLPADILADMAIYGRRNISMLTQAPTGSVAIISKLGNFSYFNVSSGVEPVFRIYFIRRKKVNPNDVGVRVDFTDVNGDSWQEYKQFSHNARAYLEKFGLDESAPLPEFFVNSDEVDWTKRIMIQAAEQKHIDHSISSTINLPAGTPNSVVSKIYMEAWKYGLKGVTVYVDGSRDGVLVTGDKQALKCENYLIGHYSQVFDKEGFDLWDAIASKLEDVSKELKEIAKAKSLAQGNFDWETADGISLPKYTKQDVLSWFTPIFDAPGQAFAPKRDKILDSETHKIRIDFGNGEPRNAYVTVSFFPGTKKPYEVLVIAPYFGLSEKDLQILELTARTTSMNLRHGVPIMFICEQLDKIGGQYIFSLPTNIARVLRTYAEEQQEEESKTSTIEDFDRKNAVPMEKCPSCGKRTYRKTGAACGNCTNEECTYSGCG